VRGPRLRRTVDRGLWTVDVRARGLQEHPQSAVGRVPLRGAVLAVSSQNKFSGLGAFKRI